jgi:S1-C subfamily serine protease
MQKLASYAAVALIAAGVAWWAASMRPEVLPAAPPGPPGEPIDLTAEERIAVEVYQNVNRSVVNITTRSVVVDEFFGFEDRAVGAGSGSVLDRAGHVLTNFHVVEGARQVNVTLFDGSVYEARFVGADPNNDLAVLQIDAPREKLYPITWGDSNRMLVGMRVYAIGNPFGLDRTLTTGIVSSLNRSLRTENRRLIRGIIQTDAAINPGNSGGPLLNRHGHMIGITTAIISRAGQSSGIGMAVPSNTARRVVEELIRNGRISRGDSGIISVFQTDRGLLISRLEPDGPAARAGLRGPQVRILQRGGVNYRVLDRSKADLIIAVDGQEVRRVEEMQSIIESKKPGEKVTFRIVRDGRVFDVEVVLGEMPEN